MDVFVVFPINLYKDVSYLKDHKVYLVEHEIYFDRNSKKFGSMKLNILKPMYHRLTMKEYESYLKKKNVDVEYCDLNCDWIKKVKKSLGKSGELSFFDPVDKNVEKTMSDNFNNYNVIDTPNFIMTLGDLEEYLEEKDAKLQGTFYKWMRHKLNILMSKGKPVGGKYTYDAENRSKPYKGMLKDVNKATKDIEENLFKTKDMKKIKDAVKYVTNNIPESHLYLNGHKYKDLKDNDYDLESIGIQLRFPYTHKGAEDRLKKFIEERMDKFGTYQDAIMKNVNNNSADNHERSLLYHSGISVNMNVGLITPEDVIDEIMKTYKGYSKKKRKDNINNVEGFIRQVIGWREFCRYTYEMKRDLFMNKNYFNSKKKLDKSWYDGSTGILPVDDVIKKAFRYGYLHHIERLMIVANYMTISEIAPKEMFKWFTEFALDSYDWVMEYNIYCMGSYSDGGNFTSKAYIGSSNYIFKMSDYSKSDDVSEEYENWYDKWDLTFWKFMKKNKAKIKKMYMLSSILKHADKNIKKLNDKLK